VKLERERAMEGKITYFEKVGGENTDATLAIARKRAEELGIKSVLVASTVGDTAVKAIDVFKGMKVVAVTHAAGFREPDFQEFTEENKKKFESKGGIVLTTGHAFIGLTRTTPGAPSSDFGDIVANSLRMFSQGVKVVAEIAVMAADAGLVRTDEDVMVVAGSGRGADTAAVVRPSNSRDLFRLRIKELLCKPLFPTPPPLPQPPAPPAAPSR
jgi:uncharacterized protein